MMGSHFLLVTFVTLLSANVRLTTGFCELRNSTNILPLLRRFPLESIEKLLISRCRTYVKDITHGLRRTETPILQQSAKNWVTCLSSCREEQCLGDVPLCVNEIQNQNSSYKSSLSFGPSPFGKFTTFRQKRSLKKEDLNKVGGQRQQKVIRKEIRRLSGEDRQRFFRAFNQLKDGQKIDNMSKMDILIVYHTPEYAPTAHFCPTFFPYHREYLKNVELATRLIEPDMGLPYWDTTVEEALPDPKDSIIWSPEFFGNGVGELVDGPFAHWRPRPDPLSPALQHLEKLTRNVSENHLGALLKERDVQELLSKRAFREFDYCVDPFMELIHGSNHFWIGGHMSDTRVAPNDPVFFFLHSFFDLIWEQWRHKHQTRPQRETEFVTEKGDCNPYCSTTNLLKPFPMKETDGLSNFYTDTLYEFEERPTCSVEKPDCGSPYLFCDKRRYRCISKIKKNGNCNGFDGTDICYKSLCVRGRCSSKALWNKTANINDVDEMSSWKIKKPADHVLNQESKNPQTSIVSFSSSNQENSISNPATMNHQEQPPSMNHQFGIGLQPDQQKQQQAEGGDDESSLPKTVWVPVTVILQTATGNQAYPAARIESTHFRYNVTLYGRHANASDEPYVTGSAFARILDPFAHTGPVEAIIKVYSELGDECSALCLNENLLYETCKARLRLSINPDESDDVPFTPNFNLAKYLNWLGRERSPDKYMFLCGNRSAVMVPSKKSEAITTSRTMPTTTVTVPTTTTTTTTSTTTTTKPTTPSTTTKTTITTTTVFTSTSTSTTTTTPKRTTTTTTTTTSKPTFKMVLQSKRPVVQQMILPSSMGFLSRRETPKNIRDTKTTEVKLIASGCLNNHICCNIWSANGECRTNPRLKILCQKDCGLCSDNSNSAGRCVDKNVLCPTWANENQCEDNSFWMQENCRLSCRACNRTRSDIETMCSAVKNCENTHRHCDYWSIVNECSLNPRWMAENCPRACKKCIVPV